MSDQQITRTFRDGYEIRVSIKRGTGTRDQDTLETTVHGETQAKAEERAERAVDNMKGLAERTREIQPETGEADE